MRRKVKTDSPRFERNQKAVAELVAQVRNEEEIIQQGGGEKAIESQHKKGRLTARERIALLIDPGTEFFELGSFVAWGMYEEWGGAPSAGVVTGLARVQGRLVMLIVNDATVKAGAFFPMTAKKVIRAQNIAIENHIPTIYLVDSAGVFLPLQEDVFPDTDDFGRVFRNNAVMSAMGIPQIAAIMGMCVAGGAYLPLMCDHILMTEGSGLFLAGPALVQAAIGAKYSAEELGGAKMHSQISGTVDFREPDDRVVPRAHSAAGGQDGQSPARRLRSQAAGGAAVIAAEEIYGIFDGDPARQYDMKEIIARIVDGSQFGEYKAEYGETVLCGYARIGGFAVGHRRQPEDARAADGPRRQQAHGVRRRHLYRVGGEGGALHHGLQPEPGAAGVSARRERLHGGPRRGVERHHPRRREDGECGVEFGGAEDRGDYRRLVRRGTLRDVRQGLRSALSVFAWPTAKYAVMSGASAAGTLVEIKIKQLERGGKKLSEEDRKKLYDEVKATYDEQMDPRYGAARLWIDKIIDPAETREAIITALEAAALNPDVPKFSVGVLQT